MYNRGRSLCEVGGIGNEWGIKSPGPFVHLRELNAVTSNKDCAGEPAATSGFTMTVFFFFLLFLAGEFFLSHYHMYCAVSTYAQQ